MNKWNRGALSERKLKAGIHFKRKERENTEAERKRLEEIEHRRKKENERRERVMREKEEQDRKNRELQRYHQQDKTGPSKVFTGIHWSEQQGISSPAAASEFQEYPRHGYEAKKGNDNTYEGAFRWGYGRPNFQRYRHNAASIQKKMASTVLDVKSWTLDPKITRRDDGVQVTHSYTVTVNPGLFVCTNERLMNYTADKVFKIERQDFKAFIKTNKTDSTGNPDTFRCTLQRVKTGDMIYIHAHLTKCKFQLQGKAMYTERPPVSLTVFVMHNFLEKLMMSTSLGGEERINFINEELLRRYREGQSHIHKHFNKMKEQTKCSVDAEYLRQGEKMSALAMLKQRNEEPNEKEMDQELRPYNHGWMKNTEMEEERTVRLLDTNEGGERIVMEVGGEDRRHNIENAERRVIMVEGRNSEGERKIFLLSNNLEKTKADESIIDIGTEDEDDEVFDEVIADNVQQARDDRELQRMRDQLRAIENSKHGSYSKAIQDAKKDIVKKIRRMEKEKRDRENEGVVVYK